MERMGARYSVSQSSSVAGTQPGRIFFCFFAAPQFHALPGQRFGHGGQNTRRRSGVHEERLQRVAHLHPLAFGVDYKFHRHIGIGVFGRILMADAVKVFQHGDPRPFCDGPDETFAAPGNDEIDEFFLPEQFAYGGVIGAVDELDDILRQSRLGCGAAHGPGQHPVGAD